MVICSYCEGEVEAATGRCLSCGCDQPGSDPEANDGPSATQEFGSIPPQTVDMRIYWVAEIAQSETGAGPGAAEPGAEQAAVDTVVSAAHAGEADAGKADAGKADRDEDTLAGAYSARRIRIKRLKTPALKRLIWAAIVQIVIVAVLMALQKVHQPQVNSGVPGATGGTFVVPVAVFVVMVVSIAAGYWFGLAGAIRVRPSSGIPIAALATWALADGPVTSLRLGGTRIDPQLSYAGLRWGQLGVLAVFWIWLGGATVARWQAQRKGPVAAPDPASEPWHPRIFQGALVCVLAYYALELAIWVLYARAGLAATGTGSLLEDLGVQAVLLPAFLVFVILLGSTDLLEWGEIGVRSAVARASRAQRPTLMTIVTALVAVAMIANVVRLDGANVPLELAVVSVPVVVVALLVRLAPGYGKWSSDIRSRAVFVGAVAIFGYIIILSNITSAIRSAIGWPYQFDPGFYSLVSIPIALTALTIGFFLLASPRTGKPEQRGRGLVLVIAGILITIAGLPAFLSASGLPAVFPGQHFSTLSGVQLAAALGTIGWLISLAMRRRMAGAGQLASVLALLAGLLIVSLILGLLNTFVSLGADSDYLLAAVFFLPVFWGFAMSGDNLTGPKANSAAYPRDGRILLLVSYTLISDATLLYLGALREPGTGQGPQDYLTADPVTPLGLAALGSALVIVAFIARMNRVTDGTAAGASSVALGGQGSQAAARPSGRSVPGPRQPGGPRRPTRSHSAAPVGIAVVGALATAAALVIFGSALPGLTRANAVLLRTPYKAPIPGPGCDTHGALWTVTPGEPITTTCGKAGLHVEIGPGPGIGGDVKFLPQNGFTSQNYRISVKIVFSKGFDGCAGIFTRASSAGRYLTAVCGDGSVNIEKQGLHGISRLYLNFTSRALTYIVTATSQGSDQSVYVDGTEMGTIADAAFPTTEYIGLGIVSNSSVAESAVFSCFSFTPLPASARH
jgi:hypothetical protein